MNIVVCVKFTPDASDIEVKSDGAISLERAEWGIGSFDLQAVEAAVQLAEATSGKVMALSAGPQRANQSKLKKDLLSRGPDELYLVTDDSLKDAGTAETAQVLAQAIQKMGNVDLVLCGEGSADLYFQQVGLYLGELLQMPTLNGISKIEPAGDGLLVERDLDDEVEVLEVPRPAVLSVTTDIHEPRLATMKEILKASKKPVTEWSLADLGLPGEFTKAVEIVSTRAPHQVQRKKVVIEGSPDEVAQTLAGYLRQEGFL